MTGKALAYAKRSGPSASPARAPEPAKRLQRAAVAPAPANVPASVQNTLDAPGRPLDAATRASMESHFGHDFSAVRIHDGPSAASSASDVGARAYTVGQDIVFGSGGYDPESLAGRSLVAHELTHTIQQCGLHRSAVAGIANESSPEYARLEREADATSRAIEAGGHAATISRASGRILSRTRSKATPAVPAGATAPGEVEIEHTVSGMGPLKQKVRADGPVAGPSKKAQLRKFRVDTFYLPGSKGEGAEERYKDYTATKQLRSVVGFSPDGIPRTELWQARDRTETLGESWLQHVGWPREDKDKLWQAITGESNPFPKIGSETAQIDHIIELQLGGTNNPSNLRPLDAAPNQESGRTIWLEVSGLAKAVRDEPSFNLGAADQIEIGFDAVQTMGTLWPASPISAPWNALKVNARAMSERVTPTDDASTRYIDIAAGANKDSFAIPATWGRSKPVAELDTIPFNKGPAQLISSMMLKRLRYGGPNALVADAELDLRNRTRIPLGTKAAVGAGGTFKLTGTKQGAIFDLKLSSRPAIVEFDYPYLSRVRLTDVALNPSGDLDWKATVTPSIKFLPALKVEYSQGQLRLVSGLGEEIKKKKLLGFSITKAEVSMLLAPEFDIKGELAFVMGDPASPLVAGNLILTKDDIGPVGTGHVSLKIPKVREAGSVITYRGGGGRDEWTLALHVRSEDFTLPGGYSVTGQVDALIDKSGELTFNGKLSAALPGENSASFELERRRGKEWVLTGRGTFKVPKVNTVSASATYFLATGRMIVSTRDVSFEIFGIKGRLNELTGDFEPEKRPVFEGAGEVELNKGKVAGKASVQLKRNGKFTGQGSVTYRFNDKLSATAGVEIDEKERLRFSGKLVLTYLKLFDAFADTKNLFDLGMSIPIPGASIGGVGLKARIGGGANAGYTIGPGSLSAITFTADFFPLEESPDLTLGVEGMASIPASARLTAYVKGGIVLDAFIAEIGGELILEGWIELKGGLFAKFSATYTQGKIAAKLTPEIKAMLLLGLALKLRAWAKAGIGWLSVKTEKTWTLGKREVDTGLGFSLSAPIEYATDTGPKFPTIDQVDLKEPTITAANMERIVKELVSGSSSTEREV